MEADKITDQALTGVGLLAGGFIVAIIKYIRRRLKRKPVADVKKLEYESDDSALLFSESVLTRKMPAQVRIADQAAAEAYFAGLLRRLRQSNIMSKTLVIDMSDVVDCNEPAAMAIAGLCRDIAEHNVLKLEFIMPAKNTKSTKLLRQVVKNSAKITPHSILLR